MIAITKALLFVSALLSGFSRGAAQPDLRALAGGQVAEKLKNNPTLLLQLLQESGIDVSSLASEAETPYTSFVGTQINFTEIPYKFPKPYAIGLEFFGIGYNAITGNPRGSSRSELDPGFGFPVLDLSAQGSSKTRGLYSPAISVMKGSKTCTYSSTASDISSTKDLQDTLNKESSEDTSLSLSVDGSAGAYTFGVSATTAFSKSEKFNQFKQEKKALKSVTLESSAICIDYHIEINPYSEMLIIGVPYYSYFPSTYGTHYISKLDMGGKFVVSSEMSSKDYQSFTSKQVDVASSFSFDSAFKFGYAHEEVKDPNKEAAKKNQEWKDKVDMEYLELLKPSCCAAGSTSTPSLTDLDERIDRITKNRYTPGSKTASEPFSIGVSVKASHNRKSSQTRIKKDNESVMSKITKTSTYNLGGLPPTNDSWQSWAATVAANPMPVSYQYLPIWHASWFANWKDAFVEAVWYIYGVRLDTADESQGITFRYGVIRGTGDAISQYSDSPDRYTRANLELEYLPTTEYAVDTVTVYVYEGDTTGDGNDWTQFVSAQDGFFACGLRARWDKHRNADGIDDRGLTGLHVRFCSVENWSDQDAAIVRESRYGHLQPWKMCQRDQYIAQVRAWTASGEDTAGWDMLGIESLEIKCVTLDGHTSTSYGDDGFDDIVQGTGRGTRTLHAAEPTTLIPGKLVQSLRVRFGEYQNDQQGIKGMQMTVADSDGVQGPSTPIYYYRSYWDLYTTQVSPIFATSIRGKVAKKEYESAQLSIASPKGLMNVESAAHYTFMDDPLRPKLAVTNFKNDVEESDLPSFSFLVADDALGILREASISAGIVHADGYSISPRSGQTQDFEVSFEDPDKPSLVTISFQSSLAPENDHVSLLVSPLWFPDAESRYPAHTGDIMVAASSCEKNMAGTEWKCAAHIGAEGNPAADKHLGFSFMAFGSNLSMASAVHGQVKMSSNDKYEVDPTLTKLNGGVTAKAMFSASGKQFTVTAGDGDLATIHLTNQRTGGVLLTFDPPFEDTPAVIVSPVVDKETSLVRSGTDLVTAPHAIVEHVTSKEALVRVGLVNTYAIGLLGRVGQCDTQLNVHQTWTLKFNSPEAIMIAGECFEISEDMQYIDAKPCTGAENQKFVYDGMRIRSHQDPAKCAFANNGFDSGRLHIHQCMSESQYIDDEGFLFEPYNNGAAKSVHTIWNRCLYKEASGSIKLSGSGSANCNADRNFLEYTVEIREDFTTKGFEIRTFDVDYANGLFDVNSVNERCLSYMSQKVHPLGVCGGTSWILSLDPNANVADKMNNDSWKLKVVSPEGSEDLYLDQDAATNELIASAGGSEFALGNGPFELFDRFTLSQELKNSRIQLAGTTNCIEWERGLGEDGVFVAENIWEPLGFNFFVIAPSKESTTATVEALIVEKSAPVGGPNENLVSGITNLRAGNQAL